MEGRQSYIHTDYISFLFFFSFSFVLFYDLKHGIIVTIGVLLP